MKADQPAADSLDKEELLKVLTAFKLGNFSVRMPVESAGLTGKIADTLNDVLELNEKMARELARVSNSVGKDGKIDQRASLGGSFGDWSACVESVNSLIGDLAQPSTEVARVIGAVAEGDFSQSMAIEVDGRPLKGESLRTARVVNTMVDQLNSFASEVTRVAREVGTEGKLGGQAVMKDVGGVWKDLTDSVNWMAASFGVLAGGVAHDFNNLLVGIMGNATLAIDMLPESSPVRSLLDDVALASQKAADLTRQMLAYTGKGRFVSEPTDLSGLVRDIAGLVRTSISKKVSLRLNLETDLPLIEADPTQVQQLIMNLLINGAEAIGDQPGTVTVTTGVRDAAPGPANGYFVVEDLNAASYVFLQVEDSGCGIEDANRSRIFEPFFTTKFTGRGLGLAAALGIVRGHKGALKVDSKLGEGSKFVILFPALSGRAVPKTAESRGAISYRAHQAKGHILIVDDEEVVRRTAKVALERYGYTVLLSENGQRAVDIFAGLSDQIALVLLDLTMPVMGGEECFHKLRKIRPDVEIVLTSGYHEAQALAGFSDSYVSGFIGKPYSGEQLAKAVRSVLSGRAATA